MHREVGSARQVMVIRSLLDELGYAIGKESFGMVQK